MSADVTTRYLSEADSFALFQKAETLATGGGATKLMLGGTWRGFLRWASNHVTTSGDTIDYVVDITRNVKGAQGSMFVNGVDTDAFSEAVRFAETMMRRREEQPDRVPFRGKTNFLRPNIWNDSSYNLDAAARSTLAKSLVEPVAQRGLIAAGYLEVTAQTRSVYSTPGMASYYKGTTAQYSVTVRNPEGTASGWAGVDQDDITKIDTAAITKRAMQKCIDSADPRMIEPGRYTTILEPQAVHDLFVHAVNQLSRFAAERNVTAYTLSPGQSKLGLKMLDERLTVSTDPMDPECSYFPFEWSGEPYRKTNWFTKGVLTDLFYDTDYALSELGLGVPLPNSGSYRIDAIGTPMSVEEMIATTTRGVLVTRLSGVEVLDIPSILCTGVTRDGLWLIEHGKISHPIKNFRFNTSPLFVFNSVEAIGTPVRVLAKSPAVVPPMRVRDFNFTSLADAV